MNGLFLFDDIVNYILNDTIDDWIADSKNRRMLSKFDDFELINLYAICVERGKFHIISPKILPFMKPDFSYVLLYSGRNTENIRSNILHNLNYIYLRYQHELNMYHLIKNQFYEGVAVMLDRELLITDSIFSISNLMAVTIKNKDIRCLKLFLDKGFRLEEDHIQYLMDMCSDYMNEQVLPILKEYEGGEESAEGLH